MGLSEKVISPHDVWSDPIDGYKYGMGTDVVHNDKNHNYGTLTPKIALQRSSNTYMARIGKLVHDKYNKLCNEGSSQPCHLCDAKVLSMPWDLGVKTGVPLPSESPGVQDFVTTNARISPLAAMVQSAFGQQERYTALQLCQYAATIANNGKRLQPQIVDKVVIPKEKSWKKPK